MFDIGMMEMLVVGVLALVVVGPKELPKLLRTVGGLIRKMREMTAEFREGVETLAAEAERELDPFDDLRKAEGIRPGMSPEEITDHILSNREHKAALGDAEIAKDDGKAGPKKQVIVGKTAKAPAKAGEPKS